ncbi:hypothetical protein Y032_0135g1924 [Ancylostoma ceylanicum]|uniref:Uncharacterized protein n=1 Tax=Ancylostoma ceylanicum TaxID=53326 RepID=A0A016T5J6_9BILA|nr:hypothetical protein Y032_0135g1924 [Ancylostoma ceylanicum]
MNFLEQKRIHRMFKKIFYQAKVWPNQYYKKRCSALLTREVHELKLRFRNGTYMVGRLDPNDVTDYT